MKVRPYKKLIDRIGYVMLFNLIDDNVRSDEHIPTHYIQIIDRSGSMSRDIDSLIEQVKDTIRSMKENDIYTVIWFSGEGEYRTILKGVVRGKDIDTDYTSESFKVLDGIKSTIGLTCFNEATKDAFLCSDELKSMSDRCVITLFTDGQSTVDGDNDCMFDLMNSLPSNVLSFNTVGYGNYCNEEYLRKWSEKSEFGVFVHSDNILEYFDIFKDNKDVSDNLFRYSVKIHSNSKGNTGIYYVTPLSSKFIGIECDTELKYLNKNKNQIIVIAEDPNSEISFNIDGIKESFKFSDINSTIRDSWINSILYNKAYADYYCGRRFESLQTLLFAGDKTLIDNHMSAFTTSEVSEHVAMLKRACRRISDRHPNTCSYDYLPDPEAKCLMDLLNIICVKGNYYDSSLSYDRIGRKVEDNFNMFVRDSNNLSPMTDIVYNEEKLNISIRFKIDGHVRINPKQANKVGLPSEFPCSILRTHTIVKDGNLNMGRIRVYLNKETYDNLYLQFESELPSMILESSEEEVNGQYYTVLLLDLNTIPVTNRYYGKIGSNSEFIGNKVINITKLMSYLKVFKYYASKCHNPITTESSKYTKEQVDLLNEYGIKNGIYSGISNSVKSCAESDYYFSRTMSFSLKGFSSLDPVSKVIDRINTGKKPKTSDEFMIEAIEAMNKYSEMMSDAEIQDKIECLSDDLKSLRKELCIVKISSVLTGSFIVGFEPDPSKIDRYLYECGKYTVVMRNSLDKTYF